MSSGLKWEVHNPGGGRRVVVTKELPGRRWLEILAAADCQVEVCRQARALDREELLAAFTPGCAGAIGQITESWDRKVFAAFKAAGGRAYSNYAVGLDNVELPAATELGIPVGNTPGVLTQATAEMGVALTLAAARRLGEAERFLRSGRWQSWLPGLFMGHQLAGKTLGVVGAGRIGAAYARIMLAGFGMNLLYWSREPKPELERFVADLSAFRRAQGESALWCRRVGLEELLRRSQVVSLNPALTPDTHHLIGAAELALMPDDAVLVNLSRGPVIHEAALVEHLRSHPRFRVGLDVFEQEPRLTPGLTELENAVLVPHLGSATRWAREGMAVLAACNLVALLEGWPVWEGEDMEPFLGDDPPRAAPSVANAAELGLPRLGSG